MAKRFGGKYSPNSDDTSLEQATRGNFQGARVDPVGARANLMFMPPIFLGAFSINDGAIGMAIGLTGTAVLVLAAWLLREGLRAEDAYNARKVARRPAFPRKMFASVLTGVGVGLAVYKNDHGLLAALIFGVAALSLHVAAFGFDPLQDKGMDGIDTHQQDRVARVVDEAERHLSAMTEAIKRAGDRQMEARVERFQETARDMIRTVEEDPRDLSSARKYLGVYLLGARDATAKFADLYARTRDEKARNDYAQLLDDLEKSFSARTRKMLLEDRSDLTVEIEVLRERLEREGVHL